MDLEIRSETRLSFEIDYGTPNCTLSYLLRAKGGTWELVGPGGYWRNIGSVKRLAWIAALTRSLTEIGAYKNERDGVSG